MKTIRYVFVLLVLGHESAAAFGQGCSDAGFCTIGNLGHRPASDAKGKQYLKLLMPFGRGDEHVFVWSPGVEYGFEKGPWAFAGRITANYASGNLASVAGLGDVFLSGTYKLPTSKPWKTTITAGAKLPLNSSDRSKAGRPLPMQYQSSLGTLDVILGISVANSRWNLAAGWQQPLTGSNGNQFLPAYWSNGQADGFPPTNDFRRTGDILLRGAYQFARAKRWNLAGGVLGIYHLGTDTYIDANLGNQPLALRGSKGLTLNVTTSMQWTFNPRWTAELTGGLPLVVRDVRPDGLTRSFVLAPQLIYHF